MRALLSKLKSGTEELNYGRDVIAGMAQRQAETIPGSPVQVLDLGLGSGADLENIRSALAGRGVVLCGVDSYEPNVARARERGVEVWSLDIEREALPVSDASLDLVVANQVLEHTKEIFWIVSEAGRALKPGGALLVGVPNLASFHSRAMLALGMQPSPIDVLGPHVRGFTKGGFKRFVEEGGFFEVVEVRGGNFYPLPMPFAKVAARLWAGGSVSLFFRCRRTAKTGRFLEVLDQKFFETPFYRGQGIGDRGQVTKRLGD
jgi:SAM-dependent methyltransferase